MKPGTSRLFRLTGWLCLSACWSNAALSPLNSPTEISGPATTINFDGRPHGTVANTLYQSLGVTFSRDDGQAVVLYDYTAIGRLTPSPPNTIGTAWIPGVNSSAVTHLNARFASPLFAIGAYFGNERGDSDFTSISLSVFGLSGDLLGSVVVAGNGNRHADQFIGLTSDIPFSRVRFDNLTASGSQSSIFAVSLDNLVFAPVPEPSTVCLLGLGILCLCSRIRRRVLR